MVFSNRIARAAAAAHVPAVPMQAIDNDARKLEPAKQPSPAADLAVQMALALARTHTEREIRSAQIIRAPVENTINCTSHHGRATADDKVPPPPYPTG